MFPGETASLSPEAYYYREYHARQYRILAHLRNASDRSLIPSEERA
jgi:hypothetical protein